MADDKTTAETSQEQEQERQPIPLGQVFFDEIFMLFMLSLVLSLLLFNVWGLLDLLRTPVFTP